MYQTKRGLLLAKAETSYGADPTPTQAANTIGVKDAEVEFQLNTERIQRKILDGSDENVNGWNAMPTVDLKFAVEARGNYTTGGTDTDISSGASAQAVEIDCLLQACDLVPTYTAETENGSRNGYVTYRPAFPDDEGESVTVWFYSAGRVHKIVGCKGTLKITWEAGKVGVFSFELKGKLASITDAAIPGSITFLQTKPPLCSSGTATVGSWTPVFRKLDFDLGNNVARREDIHASDGVKGFLIAERKPKLSIDPESVVEATHPIWGDLTASTSRTITAAIGTTAGNRMQLAFIGESIAAPYADVNGVRGHNLEYEATRALLSDAAGNLVALKFY